MTARLKSGFWVRAHIRRCAVAGVSAFVVAMGDESAGAVLIKVNRLGEGCQVFTARTGLEGEREWQANTGPAPVAESEADDYIGRQRGYDPDLWVIEIEDLHGRHFLDEPVG